MMLPLCHGRSPLDINFSEFNGLNNNYCIENEYLTSVEMAESSKQTILPHYNCNYRHNFLQFKSLKLSS